MGISPWYKTSNATAPIWTIQLVPDSGTFNVSGLVVGNFALLFRDLDTGVETTGVGTFSIITAAVTVTNAGQTTIVSPASVQYQVALAEVPTVPPPVRKRVYVLVTLSGGGVEPFQLQEDWVVMPL